MRALRAFLGIILFFSVLIVCLLTSVDYVALHDKEFYYSQYQKNNVYETVSINEEDLEKVTDNLINYMKGSINYLNLIVDINGTETQFFNSRELDHMVDVRNLMMSGKNIRDGAAVAAVISFAALMYLGAGLKSASKYFVFGIPVLSACIAVLGFIISRDFTTAFNYFHEIFFTNDLWQLDYTRDRLINIVPESFFIAMALKIGIIFVLVLFFIWIISLAVFLKKRNKAA